MSEEQVKEVIEAVKNGLTFNHQDKQITYRGNDFFNVKSSIGTYVYDQPEVEEIVRDFFECLAKIYQNIPDRHRIAY